MVVAYFLLTLLGMLLFGEAVWMRHAEAFSVFFRVVSWLSPLWATERESGGQRARGVHHPARPRPAAEPGRWPAERRGLRPAHAQLGVLRWPERTYWWLARIGVNPLDFPGRSAVALPNTWGLLATFAALLLLLWRGGLAGPRAGRPAGASPEQSSRAFVLAIVPIALGYHFAHYLTVFLVDVQYAAITFNDPFGRGWDLFGLAHAHVTTSFLTNFASVRLIWQLPDRQHRHRSRRCRGDRPSHRHPPGATAPDRNYWPAADDGADDRLHPVRAVAAVGAGHRLAWTNG